MGLSTAMPPPEVARRNRCHMGRRLRVRCPVGVNTRVSKAKAEPLGPIDRHAHTSRFAGFLVPTDHVLKDDPPREHVHGSAHLAIQGMRRLAVRRLAQFRQVQDVRVTKCRLVQTDKDLVLLNGANPRGNQIAVVLRENDPLSRAILVSQRARQLRHHHRCRHPKIRLGLPIRDWRKPTRQVKCLRRPEESR